MNPGGENQTELTKNQKKKLKKNVREGKTETQKTRRTRSTKEVRSKHEEGDEQGKEKTNKVRSNSGTKTRTGATRQKSKDRSN